MFDQCSRAGAPHRWRSSALYRNTVAVEWIWYCPCRARMREARNERFDRHLFGLLGAPPSDELLCLAKGGLENNRTLGGPSRLALVEENKRFLYSGSLLCRCFTRISGQAWMRR